MSLACKDRSNAATIRDSWKDKLTMAANQLAKETSEDAKRKEEFAPIAALLNEITITTEDQNITIKAHGSAQVIELLLKLR